MAKKNRPSVQKREREQKKRDRERKKAEKAAHKRERAASKLCRSSRKGPPAASDSQGREFRRRSCLSCCIKWA